MLRQERLVNYELCTGVCTLASQIKGENKFREGSVFSDITPCSPLSVTEASEEHVTLHLQLRLLPAILSRHIPPKRRLTFNELHGVISQKTEVFVTAAVRTSNPAPAKNFWEQGAEGEYVGVLISLWLFLFSYLQHNQNIFSWTG
jgi:hypothetical protein